jgi:predicted DNA-binding transcriptional regulator YafY
MPSRYQARVTVHAPAATMYERPYLWGSIEAIDERTCEVRASDDSLDWLAMRIGMLGVDFEVHEPPELAQRMRALAARFGRAAG